MAALQTPTRARARVLQVAAALVALPLLALAFLVATNLWVAWSARGLAYTDIAAVPARTVAIVPGASVQRGQPLPTLKARLEAALALYRTGRVQRILISGNDTPASPEVGTMQSWLREHGVPLAGITVDGGGTRTRETMNRAARLYDVSGAVICTQEVNMPRSLFLARQAGIDSVGVVLPSRFVHSVPYRAREALKSSLAALESLIRPVAPIPERTARPLIRLPSDDRV